MNHISTIETSDCNVNICNLAWLKYRCCNKEIEKNGGQLAVSAATTDTDIYFDVDVNDVDGGDDDMM